MMLAPQYTGMMQAVAFSLAVVMVLNLLTMFFIDQVMRPGVMLVLTVLASVFGLVQLGLGMELIVNAFKQLGLFQAAGL